jgi:hypothetical protein
MSEAQETKINLDTEDTNIEIEIVDDTPESDRNKFVAPENTDSDEDISAREDEITKYKDDIQKRIKDLSAKAHAERRAKEAAAKERDEAIRYAQHIIAENQKLKEYSSSNENALIETAKKRTEIQIEAIKRQAKEAFEAGETEQFLNLQEQLQKAVVEQDKYASYTPRTVEQYNQVTQRQYQQAMQQQQSLPQNQQQVAPPDPKALQWYEGNKWFQAEGEIESEMTAYAFGVSDILINKRGIDPTSQEYYDQISKSVRQRFPDYAGFKSSKPEEPPTRTQTVVAPATRSVNGNRKMVQLTPTQVRLARRLNLTTEQYAAQLLKENAS